MHILEPSKGAYGRLCPLNAHRLPPSWNSKLAEIGLYQRGGKNHPSNPNTRSPELGSFRLHLVGPLAYVPIDTASMVVNFDAGMNDQIPVNLVGLSCLFGFWQKENATQGLEELLRWLEREGKQNNPTVQWQFSPSFKLSPPNSKQKITYNLNGL